MTGLRIIRKKVFIPCHEYGLGIEKEATQDVLQYHAGNHGWIDVPVIDEKDLPTNNSEDNK